MLLWYTSISYVNHGNDCTRDLNDRNAYLIMRYCAQSACCGYMSDRRKNHSSFRIQCNSCTLSIWDTIIYLLLQISECVISGPSIICVNSLQRAECYIGCRYYIECLFYFVSIHIQESYWILWHEYFLRGNKYRATKLKHNILNIIKITIDIL